MILSVEWIFGHGFVHCTLSPNTAEMHMETYLLIKGSMMPLKQALKIFIFAATISVIMNTMDLKELVQAITPGEKPVEFSGAIYKVNHIKNPLPVAEDFSLSKLILFSDVWNVDSFNRTFICTLHTADTEFLIDVSKVVLNADSVCWAVFCTLHTTDTTC